MLRCRNSVVLVEAWDLGRFEWVLNGDDGRSWSGLVSWGVGMEMELGAVTNRVSEKIVQERDVLKGRITRINVIQKSFCLRCFGKINCCHCTRIC